MSEPTSTTVTEAPGAAGRRVGQEGTYASHPPAAAVPEPKTTIIVKGQQEHEPPEHTTAAAVPEPKTTIIVKGEQEHEPPEHTTGRLILLVILCFLLPPLAVGLEEGFGNQVCLNVLLLIFCWIPAIIHA